jgi:hypothetical protein
MTDRQKKKRPGLTGRFRGFRGEAGHDSHHSPPAYYASSVPIRRVDGKCVLAGEFPANVSVFCVPARNVQTRPEQNTPAMINFARSQLMRFESGGSPVDLVCIRWSFAICGRCIRPGSPSGKSDAPGELCAVSVKFLEDLAIVRSLRSGCIAFPVLFQQRWRKQILEPHHFDHATIHRHLST